MKNIHHKFPETRVPSLNQKNKSSKPSKKSIYELKKAENPLIDYLVNCFTHSRKMKVIYWLL